MLHTDIQILESCLSLFFIDTQNI